MLPEAVSEALGISLSEVCDLYFGELDVVCRDHLIWERVSEIKSGWKGSLGEGMPRR
jgi:hypothetical protein